MDHKPTDNVDEINRDIAQKAQTDTELESVVPPTYGPASWWRIGLVVLAIIVIGLLIIRSM